MNNNSQMERAARDSIIDLLGFGYTYPLTDLEISDQPIKVPFNNPANIPILLSQADVIYQLHNKDKTQVKDQDGNVFEVQGNAGQALLPTENISEEVIYKIWARKNADNESSNNIYAAYLNQTVNINVGLDTSLKAKILDTPLLDPTITIPKDTDARIIHYNQVVNVEIVNSQEGVQYQLFQDKNNLQSQLSEQVTGLGKNQSIIIPSKQIPEDCTLYIRAKKIYDESEDQENESDWIQVALPVKVRGNTQLELSIAPAAIIDFNSQAIISIVNSQASVRYRVFQHEITDAEYEFNTTSQDLISIPVPGFADVQIGQPARNAIWHTTPIGYSPASDWQQGTGNQVSITLDALSTDSLIIIQAEKNHLEQSKKITSAVQLQNSPVILVRPDPDIPLNFRMPVLNNSTKSSVQISKGQAGVFYHFSLLADGEEISLPAYFHKWTSNTRPVDKGINQLRLNIDFVVTNNYLAQTPVVDFADLPSEAILHILARKALSNVSIKLTQTLALPELSQFQSQIIEVEQQAIAEIQILQSNAEVDYQLLIGEETITEPVKGNGAILIIATAPLSIDTVFTVRSTHYLEGGLTFALDQMIEVNVKQT